MKRNIALLGSTGSIGLNTLEVVRRNRDLFNIVSLSCGENIDLLKDQIREFSPSVVSVKNNDDLMRIESEFGEPEIYSGDRGITEAVSHQDVDTVVLAIPGTVALQATVKSIGSGHRICLANKETLVAAGDLIYSLLDGSGSEIIPVDSEQSAIFQVLCGNERKNLKKVILTASGGPFFRLDRELFGSIKREDALKHPTWKMGEKITIDSATLMNKALEVIEAFHLFSLRSDQIDVIIHPQSIVHSMVEYVDTSVFAQISSPDMKLPIQYSLTYPDRIEGKLENIDFASVGKLEFFNVDFKKFPSVKMAFDVVKNGGKGGLVLNASNEVAVDYFIKEKISFTDIFKVVEDMLNGDKNIKLRSVDDVLSAIDETKSKTRELIEKFYL